MTGLPAKNFNLPWHQYEHYWIGIYPKGERFPEKMAAFLRQAGFLPIPDHGMGLRTPRDWKSAWEAIYAGIKHSNALQDVEVSVSPATEQMLPRAQLSCKHPTAIQAIADNLWLGDALLEGRLMCYLQPVVGAQDKIFGYESFARVKKADGSIVNGASIIEASKTLGIEFMIDRHLHIQAITTFMESEFNGFLFVNFFPGFIHRPAVYLEGLSDTVKNFGIIPKHIVLEFTKAETPRDPAHIKSVCDYARSRGYSIALDDIATLESARRLIPEIRPDFVKIDMHLVHEARDIGKRETIRTIVDLTHANGGAAIAEGVESEAVHEALKSLGVDLFQGYLFSPPVPVKSAFRKSGTV